MRRYQHRGTMAESNAKRGKKTVLSLSFNQQLTKVYCHQMYLPNFTKITNMLSR